MLPEERHSTKFSTADAATLLAEGQKLCVVEPSSGAQAIGMSQELLDALAIVEETSVAEEICDSLLYRARRTRAFAGNTLACSMDAGGMTAVGCFCDSAFDTVLPTGGLSQRALDALCVFQAGLSQPTLDWLAVTNDAHDSTIAETLKGELESHHIRIRRGRASHGASAIVAVAAEAAPRAELSESLWMGRNCNALADITPSSEPDICQVATPQRRRKQGA